MSCSTRLARFLLIAIALRVPTALAESSADPAALVPRDALVYLGFTDVEKVWETYTRTADYKLMQDAALKESVSELGVVHKLIEKFRDKLAGALDVPADQLKNPFRGPLAVYLGAEADEKEPFAVVAANVGDRELMDRYFESATKKLKAVASDAQVVEVGSRQVLVFKNTRSDAAGGDASSANQSADEPASDADDALALMEKGLDELFTSDTLPPELALCRSETQFLIATRQSALMQALRLEPGATLAEHEDLRAGLRLLEPVGPVRYLINLPRLMELMRKVGGSSDAQTESFLKALGGECLKSAVGHWEFGAAEFDGRFDMLLLMSGERRGLAKMLSLENRSTAAPESVDSNTQVHVALHASVPALLDEIERMLRQADPQAADQMRQSLEAVPLGEKPVNLRKELLDHLTGPIQLGLDLRKPYLPEEVRLSLSIGTRGREALTRFLSQLPQFFSQRDVRGTAVFSFAIPVFPFALAPLNDRLVLGTTPAVDSAIAGSSGLPLAETPMYRRAARLLPAESWLTVFVDEHRLTEALLGYTLDEAALMNPGNVGAQLVHALRESMVGEVKGGAEVGRRLLPYRGASMFVAATTPDGLRFSAVELKPAGGD